MAKVTIDFKGRKYTYNFIMPSNPTKHNIALAISIAKGKQEGITKYTGMPKDYNLIIELLNHNSRFVNLYGDHHSSLTMKNYFDDATQRNNEEKPIWNEQTQRYERLLWRVGLTQNKVLIIDIDGQNKENLNKVKSFYEPLLNCKFTVVKSNKGYWLISDKKYESVDSWKLDHCKVLYPSIQHYNYNEYVKGLELLDFDGKGNFKKISVDDFKKSHYFKGVGDYDIMFTLLSIKRERSTIRISKKRKDDKIEVLT